MRPLLILVTVLLACGLSTGCTRSGPTTVLVTHIEADPAISLRESYLVTIADDAGTQFDVDVRRIRSLKPELVVSLDLSGRDPRFIDVDASASSRTTKPADIAVLQRTSWVASQDKQFIHGQFEIDGATRHLVGLVDREAPNKFGIVLLPEQIP